MLTDRQSAVIKQTVPVLQEHGEALAAHMYQRMFRENPEVQGYFNPAHQRSGTQQRALASAVVAYAQHIDNPEALAGAVELIAQKHVSLTIRPEHYPIVGKHLLASIREVLGEAATDEIIDAWAAAYAALADIFVKREQQIYDGQDATYGWHGFKEFVIARREPASDNIMSLYLEPADGRPLAPHKAGQYVAIRADLPDGRRVMRNYSLSNAPGTSYFRISVKRETAPEADAPDGVFSNYLHNQLQVGDRVALTPPCGEFTLDIPEDERKPLVFIAGGVGVTPLLSMLQSALDHAAGLRPIVFIQGALNGAVHAFADELRTLQARHPNLSAHVRYSDPLPADRDAGGYDSEGLIDDGLLEDMVGGQQAAYYFCGPQPMLAQVNRLLSLRDVAEADRRYEFFGPAGTLAA
ncbi:MAG: NO-inducible flavohemoprotein [Salinisphaera sp.]|jgi:nitric oxide dioxygenase|nr:NO-inducible flavohemoprotein [Salinisphaera sp.]